MHVLPAMSSPSAPPETGEKVEGGRHDGLIRTYKFFELANEMRKRGTVVYKEIPEAFLGDQTISKLTSECTGIGKRTVEMYVGKRALEKLEKWRDPTPCTLPMCLARRHGRRIWSST